MHGHADVAVRIEFRFVTTEVMITIAAIGDITGKTPVVPRFSSFFLTKLTFVARGRYIPLPAKVTISS